MNRSILSLAIVLALAPCVRAESLGDAAKREEERRKKVEESGKGADHVISAEELAANKGRTATEGGTAPAVAPRGSSSDEPVPPPRPGRSGAPSDGRSDGGDWAARAAALEARVKTAEQELAAAKAAPLSIGVDRTVVTDTRGRSIGTLDSGGTYAEARKEHDRNVAAAERRLEAARGALDALEDEARRQSVPPGALRGQ